jgi:hypothetical protein
MHKQLQRDITANANDRLSQWVQDTIMRCQAAKMKEVECKSLMAACLLAYLAGVTALNKEQAADLTKSLIKIVRSEFTLLVRSYQENDDEA